MRLLRTLAPLALVAILASACGSGSSSGSSSGPSADDSVTAASSNQLEVRPVFARYSPGVQFGPAVPKDLQAQMSHQACPMKPAVVQDMLMECDADKTVYLMKAPITTGGVDSVVAKQIGHTKEWFLQVTLDPATASTLKAGTASLVGTDVAYSYRGQVITSVIVDSSFNSSKLAVIGSFDKASATRLAHQLSAS